MQKFCNLSQKSKVVLIIGILALAVSAFFFRGGFIANLLWQGCYDNGFSQCVKSDRATHKAYTAIVLFIIGVFFVMYGFINRKNK